MSKTALHAEAEKVISKYTDIKSDNPIVDYLAKAAVYAADELPIKEIVIGSRTAFSAEVIASYRSKAPIFVKCFDHRRVREFALTYGVNAHWLDLKSIKKPLINFILEKSVEKKKLDKKDLVIFLSSDAKENMTANFMEICEVAKYVG